MSWSKGVLLAVALSVTAAAAGAEPLGYVIQRTAVVRVLVEGDFEVTYTPPLGLGAPSVTLLTGTSDLTGFPSGSAEADVGLPDQFAGGVQGLLLSAFDAHTDFNETGLLITNVFDDVVPLLPAPPPIPLAGAVVFVDIADLDVNLLGPLESSLLSLGDPSVYHWGGVAPLRIAGSLNLLVSIPGQDPIQLATASFGLETSEGALAGTFGGDASLTRLVVGLEEATLSPDTTALIQPYVIDLSPLGVIRLTPKRLRLTANASYTALNREYGLPAVASPGFACGIGPELAALLPALAWLRRRREPRTA